MQKDTELELDSEAVTAKSVQFDDTNVEHAIDDDARVDGALDGKSSLRSFLQEHEVEERAHKRCCPYGINKHAVPLILAVIAFALTFTGSWTCSYFQGANTGFAGDHFGLWTLEDYYGQCQPWDVIFYSYSLGSYLQASRALSMTAIVLGMSLLTAMSQALKCFFISWSLGLCFFALFIVSLSTNQKFNVWILFFLLLYIVLVLIVRALFIHPVHRAISSRGNKYIAWLMVLCSLLTILTLLILNSDFCQCERLTIEKLEGREKRTDICDTGCSLGPAGIIMVVASGAWLLAAFSVFRLGVQPEGFHTEETNKFAGYNRKSITTRVLETRVLKAMRKARNEGVEEVADESEESPGELESGQMAVDVLDDEDQDAFQRTWCMKCCCDYRVTKRSKKKKAEFWCFRICLVAVYVVFGIAIVFLIGARIESGMAERAPDTSPSFITNVTCAFNASDPSAPFITYQTPEAALADNMTVAHCGECSHCSNMHDIETYIETRETIAIKAKSCGATAVLGSYGDLDACLERVIDFTPECRTCWLENMLCDTDLCILTCMKTLFTGFMTTNNVPISGDAGRLNWCIQCDEKRCGTAFVTCSGVARRRLGISSEIERVPKELCPHVGVKWTEYEF